MNTNLGNKTRYSRIRKVVTTAVLLTFFVGGDSIAQTQRKLEESKAVQLLALETKLDELLVQYTEFHPEVVRLRQQIQLLAEERGTAALDQSGPSIATKNTNGSATAKVPPPSYDEVMQRALSQKKATSNAPAASPVAPVVPLPTSSNESASKPSATTPMAEVKTLDQQPSLPLSAASTSTSSATNDAVPTAVTSLPPAASAATVAPSTNTTAGTAPSPSSDQPSETAKPTKVQPKKGAVFSPLPPDLAPTNGTPKGQSASASLTTPDSSKVMETLDDKHLLAIGDRLSFRIVEDEDEPRPLTVMDSGELEVPHIGRFVAVNKSCKALAVALKSELEKEYYYQATVILAVDLMARSRGRVYLVGPVRMPGPQEIPSDESFTLSKAILRAGGFSDFADKKNVKITRKAPDGLNEDHITVDVSQILEKGRTAADVALQPGDLIYIPERLIRF